MASPSDPNLSLAEAAPLLGRSASEVRELIEEGELRFAPTRDVNFIRVPRSAIDEFLELHPSGRMDGCDGSDGSDGS